MDEFIRQEAKKMKQERERLEKMFRQVSLGNYCKSQYFKNTIIVTAKNGKTELYDLDDPRTAELFEAAKDMNAVLHSMISKTHKRLTTPSTVKERFNEVATTSED